MAEDLWVQLVPGKADKLSPQSNAVQSHTKENIDEENAIMPFYTAVQIYHVGTIKRINGFRT